MLSSALAVRPVAEAIGLVALRIDKRIMPQAGEGCK
jgi:hypothetical protein